ncbi:hypothetical protein [Salipiger thiooxidans]|uniref:hypothetical protein n=1 Tax=Salipiger thiooxidans TaxID=282683 RepID=UPI001CFC339B|nr:hypothetical protein [Salipiger thiooxidans]
MMLLIATARPGVPQKTAGRVLVRSAGKGKAMNQFNHSAYEQEIGSAEEEPRQRLKLEIIGKAALMWADPTVPKKQVVVETGLRAGELRRLFGRKPHSAAPNIGTYR